jgi:hypothetical protein
MIVLESGVGERPRDLDGDGAGLARRAAGEKSTGGENVIDQSTFGQISNRARASVGNVLGICVASLYASPQVQNSGSWLPSPSSARKRPALLLCADACRYVGEAMFGCDSEGGNEGKGGQGLEWIRSVAAPSNLGGVGPFRYPETARPPCLASKGEPAHSGPKAIKRGRRRN